MMTTAGLLRSAGERVDLLLGGSSEENKDVVDGVNQLKSEIIRIVNNLMDADARNKNIGAESYSYLQQARELAYDIEDSVECFVRRREVEARSCASGGLGAMRCLFFKYCWSCEGSFVEGLRVLNRKAMSLLQGDIRGEPERQTMDSVGKLHDPPSAQPQRSESVPIGLDEYQTNLKQRLQVEEGLGLSVTAVCGPGGIGKTTLAQLVYNDPKVRQHFRIGAWSKVGHDYQARTILEALSTTLFREKINYIKIVAMETMELTQRLYKSLKGRKYLICLDDVCSVEAWDSLRFVFPDDGNGSRIIVTTRSMDLAAHISRSKSIPIEIKRLTDEQSWKLFLTKSGLLNNPIPGGTNINPQLIAELGKPIVKSCEGLPLAIIMIVKVLSRKTLDEWKLIQQKVKKQSEEEKEEYTYAVDLSYTNLSPHLKPCFLYMGHFPPDQPISVEKLHLLWMAEGLISDTKDVSIDAGADYFDQLVDRNLVIGVEKEDWLNSTRFTSGQVHDIIRDLCISRGKQEDFFEVIDFSHKLNPSTRRLAVYLGKFKDSSNDDATEYIPDAKRIRTILFFDAAESVPEPTWPSELADLTNFHHVRVLDFDGVDFRVRRFPRGVEKLVYLRHLSFRGCYMEEFPSSFGNFFFLETLDLRVIDTCIMKIPNILRKLTRLRRLYFPLAFRRDGKEKLKLGSLKNLQVVENFHSGSCDAKDLLLLENLQILKGTTVDGNNSDLTNIMDSIKKMKSIRHSYSSLVLKRFDCLSDQRRSVVAQVLQCEALNALDLEGHLGFFPKNIDFGSNFTEMVFDGSEFEENPMPILGKLPNLKSLILCKDAYAESELECYNPCFPQLTTLKLASLQSLEKWKVEGGSMPCLSLLTIEQCNKLEMLPSELVAIPTLQNLMIGSMPEKFQLMIKEIITETNGATNNKITVTFYDC